MKSREIVQRLIDEHVINGEEAFTLINDICKNEIYDVWKTLEETEQPKWLTYTHTTNPYSVTSPSSITTGTGYTTAISGSTGPNI